VLYYISTDYITHTRYIISILYYIARLHYTIPQLAVAGLQTQICLDIF